MVNIVALFCNFDVFCKTNKLTKLNVLDNNKHTRNRKNLMIDSKIITILILWTEVAKDNLISLIIDQENNKK